MTLNGVMAVIYCGISPKSVAFRTYDVNVVEDTPIHSASEM